MLLCLRFSSLLFSSLLFCFVSFRRARGRARACVESILAAVHPDPTPDSNSVSCESGRSGRLAL